MREKITVVCIRFSICLLAAIIISGSMASAEERVFKLDPPGQKEIEFMSLGPGLVTVRAYIERNTGRVEDAIVLVESERSGAPEMWSEIVDIIDSWSYTSDAFKTGEESVFLDIRISNPRSDEGNPWIEIDASSFKGLREEFQLPHGNPELLVAARGINSGNMELTRVPPEWEPPDESVWEGIVGIWHNMDQFNHTFQIIFVLIFLLFVWFLISAFKAAMQKWSPEDGRMKGAIPFCNAEDMFRGKVKYIKTRWVSIILKLNASDNQKDQICNFVNAVNEKGSQGMKDVYRMSDQDKYSFVNSLFRKAAGAEEPDEESIAAELEDMKEFAEVCSEYKGNKEKEWNDYASGKIKKIRNKIEDEEVKYDLFEILEAGLHNHLVNQNEWWTSQEIDRAVDRIIVTKVDRRNRIVDKLWTIGSISPLVGLFGTVVGISTAFGKLQGLRSQSKIISALSGEINIALSTTIVGLVLGILAFSMYYLIKNTISKKAALIESFIVEITNEA